MTEQNWRDHLSVPPKQHTFPEIMRTIILMAAEDAAALEETPPNTSARSEFHERIGYDLYDAAMEFLDSPLFTAVDRDGEPTLPSDAGKTTLLDPPEGEH